METAFVLCGLHASVLQCFSHATGGEQVWQLPPGATCSRQGNAPGGYGMGGGYQDMNQMWGGQMGQMQQMPYGYNQNQQSWY